jgi:hypothetical protein
MMPSVEELIEIMDAKSTEELLGMFKAQDDWSLEAMDAANTALKKRGEEAVEHQQLEPESSLDSRFGSANPSKIGIGSLLILYVIRVCLIVPFCFLVKFYDCYDWWTESNILQTLGTRVPLYFPVRNTVTKDPRIELASDALRFSTAMAVLGIALAIFGIYVGYRICNTRPGAIALALCYEVALIAYSAVWIAAVLGPYHGALIVAIGPVGTILLSLICGTYLLRSVRVREAFPEE